MSNWTVPHIEDINLMKLKANQFDKNTMIPVELWDGDCWHSLFNHIRDKIVNDNEELAWEYLAHFIQSLQKED